ncbi:MAG: SpoIIE family protein phosphatase [Acidimicrobiia bacterium]
MTDLAEDEVEARIGTDSVARAATALLERRLFAELDPHRVLQVVADVAREETGAEVAWIAPALADDDSAADRPGSRLTAVLWGPDGAALGTLVLGSVRTGAFHAGHRRIADALARHGAVALHNARLLSDAQAAARRERGHAKAMRALAETAVRLNAPLPIDEMLRDVTDTARRIVGADYAVSTLTTGMATPIVATAEGFAGGLLAEPFADVPPAMDALRHPQRLAAPLRGPEGADLGVLQVLGKETGDFTDTDEAIVVQLAQLAATAIEKERLLEAQLRLAGTLQRSLLPERLPDVPGVAMAARYSPGAAEVDVGGDWYDALSLPDGDLFLVIGDVVGKGVEAAAAMGQLRHSLRAYAFEGFEPAAALERLNMLVNTLGGSEFATVVAARLTPSTGRLRYASAGHPPPLLMTDEGDVEFLEGAQSVPLGALPQPEWEEGRRMLAPGTTLVFYTDGLVESRSLHLDMGMARLADAAAGGGELADVVDRLLDLARLEHQRDDSAVLAVHIAGCVEQFRVRLPAEFASVATVRQRLRAFLTACGVDDQTTDEVTLACSEAAANAVEHPVAPRHHSIEVEGSVEDDVIRVTVRDFGRWRPPPTVSERGRGLALMGMLMDVEVAALASGTEVVLRRQRDGQREMG